LYEHTFGIIRNNVVVNCHNDVGVYINKAPDSQVYGNYVLGSLGIDIRYKESHAQVYDNQIDGRIKTRDGASIN
jgi:nitrous oxidase accessory protein NosD